MKDATPMKTEWLHRLTLVQTDYERRDIASDIGVPDLEDEYPNLLIRCSDAEIVEVWGIRECVPPADGYAWPIFLYGEIVEENLPGEVWRV